MPYKLLRQYMPSQQGEHPIDGITLGTVAVTLEEISYGSRTFWRLEIHTANVDLSDYDVEDGTYRVEPDHDESDRKARERVINLFEMARDQVQKAAYEYGKEALGGLSLEMPGGATEDEKLEELQNLLNYEK